MRSRFGDTFAQSSVKGALARGALAWVLITPPVAAAKIWWSGTAALAVGLGGVITYVVVTVRYLARHRER